MQTNIINYRTIKSGVYMPELELKQLQFEIDSWRRVLESMSEENTHLKVRLSEALKNSFDKKLLVDAEAFLTKFVKEDELIGLLRNELVELDKLLAIEMFEDGLLINKIERKFKKLRTNASSAEVHFSNLKMDFNKYLSKDIFNNAQ